MSELGAKLWSGLRHRGVLAAVVVTAAVLWMASGLLAQPESAGDAQSAEDAAAEEPFAVAVEERAAQTIERALVAQSETRPYRAARLRAQTAGQVAEVRVDSGQSVKQGDVLVRLAPGDRTAQLKEAKALVSQRELELEAAQRLSQSGYQSRVQVQQARTALEQAEAQLSRVRQDIDYATIEAPWAGRVDEILVDAGDYLGVNGEAVTLVDNHPLKVVGHFPQSAAGVLKAGQQARVTLLGGETREGPVNAVAPRSDSATRTFRVEAEIPNPQGTPAGTSAEMRIVVGEVRAHRVSPALLSLGGQGELGVKAVGANDEIVFHPVEVVRTEPAGAWVTGLPDPVRLVVRGGGFVAAGERVRTRESHLGTKQIADPPSQTTATDS